MAAGVVHDRVGLVFGVALGVFLIPFFNVVTGFYLLAGYVAGIVWLSPDIDLAQSVASSRWRCLRGLWAFYRTASGHRGFSHWPIFGTLSRVLYLGMLITPALVFLGLRLDWETQGVPLLLGLEVSALVHLALDKIADVTGLGKNR